MDATMLKVDEAILESNKIICRQISRLGTSTRGEVSQEILESLRHFVEHIILKEYANGDDIEDTHDNIKSAVKFAKSQPQLIHISRFHHFLQVSSSHRVLKEQNAERLMLKYYEYLFRIKKYLHDKYSMVVLENLDQFPLDANDELTDYYYSADLSEKVLRGHTENALKCKYNGGTMPIGYYADKEQHYVADSLTAPFVLEAFRHYDEGLTMSEIAAVLNQHGLKNKRGGDIDIDSVSRMLSNRKYIGEYRYRDIVIPNGIPALVPQDLFDRVQEKIAKNKKAPARHKAEDDYLLTTKLFCGECESLMVGECGTSRSGAVHHYYKCTNAKRHGGCRKKAVKKDWIENLVVLEIRKKLEDARFIDDIVHAFMEFQTAENTVIPHLKQSLAELNKSIDNILAAIEQGIFTQSTKQRLEELESKKKDIEIEIAKESIRRPLLNEDQVRFWFERLRNLNINELSHQKRLIDTFLNSVFVYDDKLLINCNYPNTSTIVRFSDINAALNGSDILACGRPKISRK